MDTYLEAAERVAGEEVDAVVARQDRAGMVEGVVTGTIIGEALFNALRRMAHEHASARRLLTADEIAARDAPPQS